METIGFASLPLTVRIAAMGSYFMAWVMFAEFVIDRHGLDAWLPFYRVGNVCPYELALIVILVWWWFRLSRR